MNPKQYYILYIDGTKTQVNEQEYRDFIRQSKSKTAQISISDKLIEIDNFRKAKKSILEGNSSPIVKGYLAGDIENRIEELKREICDMIGGY